MGYKNDFSKEEVRDKIVNLLLSTGREGMSNLINHMDKNGFFTAPCSGGNHLAKEGGLAEHSLNVYFIADGSASSRLDFETYVSLSNSIIIASLLHDYGKIGQFGKSLYVDNILNSGKRSEAKPYVQNSDLLDKCHEVVSAIEVGKFIQLTEEEQYAITRHNGLYGVYKYDIPGKEIPLYLLIHEADMWASRVVELEEGAGEE